MASQPDLVLQLAHHIERDFARRGYGPVEVRAESMVSLNGRRGALLVDPDVDLDAPCDDGLGPARGSFRPRRRVPWPRPVRERSRAPCTSRLGPRSCEPLARCPRCSPRRRSPRRRRRRPTRRTRARAGARARSGRATPVAPTPPDAARLRVEVSSAARALAHTAGSAQVLQKEQLERFEYDDPSRDPAAGPGRLRARRGRRRPAPQHRHPRRQSAIAARRSR